MANGFVGRTAELEAIREALQDGGRLLLFAGDAGFGKSRLAAEAVALARNDGFVTAAGRCRETAGAPPFWPWTQVMRGLRAELGAAFDALLERDVEPLMRVLPELGADTEIADPFVIYDALARVLARLAAQRALLIVLDDLHAADLGSIQALRFVASELSDRARLVLLGTYREAERSEAFCELVGDMVTARGVRLFALEGLDSSEVAQLIGSIDGSQIGESAARAVRERTGGNPFFVTELARLGLDGPVPHSVREAIETRVRRLPEPTRAVLATCSVLGRDFGGELLESVAAVGAVSLIAALQPAAQARLISSDAERQGNYRFVHALVQEVIYASLAAPARSAIHARAADAIDRSNQAARAARIDELAFHACAGAVDAAGRQRAAALCEEAARSAKAALAFDNAARWFARCVELEPARRTLDLLFEHARTLHGSEARRCWEEAFELALGEHNAAAATQAVLGLGEVVVSAGYIDQALLRLIEQAERLAGDDEVTSIRLQARRAIELYWQTDHEPAQQIAAHAVARAEASRDLQALGAALLAQCYVLRGPENLVQRIAIGERLLQLALATRDEELELRAYVRLLPEHLQAADLLAVARDQAALEALANRTRRPLARWYLLLFKGLLAGFQGRFHDALATIDQARSLGRRLADQPAEIYAAGQRALVLRELGRAQESIDELRDVVSSYPIFVALECELAMLLAETGASAQARELLERIAAHDFAVLPRDALWRAGIAFAARAAALLDHAAHARATYTLLRPFAGTNIVQGVPIAWGAVDHYLGVAAAGARDLDRAVIHFDEAVRLHTNWGAGALCVASQAELANALLARGRAEDRARVVGLEACVRAEAARLGILRPLLARDAPSGRRVSSGLSEREQEVLSLLAAGQANKEIAHVLRISVHTVERHIANIYAKIGVRNRVEATAYADAQRRSST